MGRKGESRLGEGAQSQTVNETVVGSILLSSATQHAIVSQ